MVKVQQVTRPGFRNFFHWTQIQGIKSVIPGKRKEEKKKEGEINKLCTYFFMNLDANFVNKILVGIQNIGN